MPERVERILIQVTLLCLSMRLVIHPDEAFLVPLFLFIFGNWGSKESKGA